MHFVVNHSTKEVGTQLNWVRSEPQNGEENKMRRLQNLLAHACVILSVSLLTLWVFNVFNPKMRFLSGGPTNLLLLLLCVCALLLGVSFIGLYRSHLKRESEKEAAEARRRRFGMSAQDPGGAGARFTNR